MLEIVETIVIPFGLKINILLVLFSISLWQTLYCILRSCLPSKSPEWSCRLVSIIHGAIAGIIGMQQCFGNPCPLLIKNQPSTNVQRLLLAGSAGYFIHDLLWCLVYKTESFLMLCHHIFSLSALIRLFSRSTSGAQACCALGGAEITNPLLQLRWFLRYAGHRESIIFMIAECLFSLLFFMVRILCGTLVMIVVKTDWEIWLMYLILYLISWLFMFNIITYFRKRIMNVHNPPEHMAQVDS
ncbi:TLC domain-containing protein 5-like [Chrysoperla carnea]|uniref:TLC domain-containing protein 5-like n=1 Tax=Chrysoperla carnea TaxID=189513 RepID=UPI001D0750A2|nr:TLC domain-containing protein 5-like [Chrysoperla carnea]